MKKKNYGLENRLARILAGSEPGDGAGRALGAAIVQSPEHEIILDGESVELVYHNEFGPTCTVDDVLERMTLLDYREACEEAVRSMLAAVSAPKYRIPPHRYPQVTLRPELGEPIIHEVTLSFSVPKKLYVWLLNFTDGREDPS